MFEAQRQETADSDTEPVVTAVICTYRRAKLVTRAIRSVQNQTYNNIEIIVVDDASPDNTGEVIAGLGDQRIRYIRHEQNKGLPAGRNTGIGAANGSYVAFLDDDDEWKANKVEQQLHFFKKSPVDALLCASYVNGKQIRRFGRQVVTLDDLRRGNNFAAGSGLMVRTSVLRNIMFDESIGHGEDWDALIRIASRYRIGYLNEPLYYVSETDHERMTNAARNMPISALEGRMEVLAKHREFFGPYWFNYHSARTLLSHFRDREKKGRYFLYTVQRCGPLAVGLALLYKVRRRLLHVT
jgi:glycosyltransferase involved in cell wall biosynthesis